jgi:formylglycine-generating enzyme required for sulfatase activity/energy-coupling factor transporter ATP-binding protein EcfA2
MRNGELRRVRIFYCQAGRAIHTQVTGILRDLSAPLDIDADPGRKETNPNTEVAIGIWVEGTRTEADFFRELNAWDARSNTDIYICRLGGPPVDSIPRDIIKGVYDYDGGLALKEWLLRTVLKINELESDNANIDSLSSAITHYNRELHQLLSASEVLNGIQGVAKKTLIAAYVPLTLLARGQAEVIADSGIATKMFNDDGKRVFVIGVPGSGKSTLTKLIAYFMAESVASSLKQTPILLRAKSIAESGYRSLIEHLTIAIKSTVRSAGKRTAEFIVGDDTLSESRLLILIDGLDELDDEQRVEVRRILKQFEIQFPRCSILVTARPSAYEKSRWSDYTLFQIRPLSKDQALSYVSLHGNPGTSDALLDLINSSEPVREIAEVPFMLALMANYAGSTTDLPRQRAQLISRCVLAVLDRRRIRSNDKLEEDQLVECLTSIAYRLFRIDPLKDHTEQEYLFAIQAYLSNRMKESMVPFQPTDMAVSVLTELIENTGLLQRSGRNIEFVHRTVWEFFVARSLANSKERTLSEFALHKAWEEPIRLATGLVSEDIVEDFSLDLWSLNPGLALRSLSESPHDTDQIVSRHLAHKSVEELAILVRDLKALNMEREGRSGSERVTLDTIKELIHRTSSAEILWESITTLMLVRDRATEAREMIRSVLRIDELDNRHQYIRKALGFAELQEGEFYMGTNDDSRTIDERPAHKIALDAFSISVVTLRNCDVTSLPFSVGRSDGARSPTETHPVIWVTWYEAQMAAIWYGCRLPTEAQWEYACRSGGADDELLTSKAAIPSFAWFADNAANVTHVGGSLKPNSFGIYDMLGNVREWCADWYQEDLYLSRRDTVTQNPTGPLNGSNRVLRGGCFDWNTANLVPTYRNSNLPANRGFQNGVRLVAGLPIDLAEIFSSTNVGTL